GGTITNPFNQPLILNGPGIANDGALVNVAGSNTWAGTIEMDSDVTFGASAGVMIINGVISDLGAGHNLTKEGPGKVYLDPLNVLAGNTYRGNTYVNGGMLSIGHPFALGPGGASAVVNANPGESGTLALEFTPSNNLLIAAQYL